MFACDDDYDDEPGFIEQCPTCGGEGETDLCEDVYPCAPVTCETCLGTGQIDIE